MLWMQWKSITGSGTRGRRIKILSNDANKVESVWISACTKGKLERFPKFHAGGRKPARRPMHGVNSRIDGSVIWIAEGCLYRDVSGILTGTGV